MAVVTFKTNINQLEEGVSSLMNVKDVTIIKWNRDALNLTIDKVTETDPTSHNRISNKIADGTINLILNSMETKIMEETLK